MSVSTTTSASTASSRATDRDTTPATSKVDVDKAIVSEAYQEALTAEIEASEVPDPSDPRLAATHLDPLLQQVHEQIMGRRIIGQVAKRPANSKSATTILAVTIDAATATVSECTVDDGVVIEVATGRVINDKVATIKRTATMQLDEGTWKVVKRLNEQEWEGIAGCAAQL